MPYETLPSMFAMRSAELSDSAALLVKSGDAFRPILWKELRSRVYAIAAALLKSGIQKGDRIGILSENRREWIEADFGILCAGGITVALHAPLTAAQVRQQFQDCKPAAIFVSTATQQEKLAEALTGLRISPVIYTLEPSNHFPAAILYDALVRQGEELISESPFSVPDEAIVRDDPCAILYTSGTTGESRGVVLTHRNFLSNIESMQLHEPPKPAREPVTLGFLPLSHVYARTCDLYYS
ncbi:MAG TPA: AMP-binding protein, partial [Chthonomonadales bacterium]|nr:AMP-binding protein [Chthonomonadales bacterium]